MIIILYLNGEGFVYRDLKPNNIMIDKNGTIVLIDLDRMIKNSIKSENEPEFTVLTSPYSAPEVHNKEQISYQTDVYSIGKIIYFLFNQEFKESKYSMLRDIYEKCIKYKPEERPNLTELIKFFNLIQC